MELPSSVSMEKKSEVCAPISKLSEVWNYTKNPPEWVDMIDELKSRSNSVLRNSQRYCHEHLDAFGPKQRLDRSFTPRTLVCHDMKGGYLEDKYVTPVNTGNCYTFYRWAQIDIFVYFSHHLITIPPLCWINCAHTNGVQILGTFITEWEDGRLVCEEIFATEETMRRFVEELVAICVVFKLDGWLLNIENKLADTRMLKKFVQHLSDALHSRVPGSIVIWYDSVTADGKLHWQNELNEHNRCFFDACDGIFLNYGWNETSLQNSLNAAKHRALDVYVGLDVFGRNCYGGGGFGSYLATQKIRQYNLSIAIFAQGWTYETLNYNPKETYLKRFLDRDNAFWRSIWNSLYTHPITATFETYFYMGADTDCYDLHTQEVQLSRALHSREQLWEDATVSTLKGHCNCLQLHVDQSDTHCYITKKYLRPRGDYVHHLFSCDIRLRGKTMIYSCVRKVDATVAESDCLSLVLLMENMNGSFQRIICYSVEREDLSNNRSLIELNPTHDRNVIDRVWYRQDKIATDWLLRCYVLELNSCRLLEIGAMVERGDNVCLCGVGMVKM